MVRGSIRMEGGDKDRWPRMDENVCFLRHIQYTFNAHSSLSHYAVITTVVQQHALAHCFRIFFPQVHCLRHPDWLLQSSRSTPRTAPLRVQGMGAAPKATARVSMHATTPSTSLLGLRWRTPIHPHSRHQHYYNERRRPSRRSPHTIGNKKLVCRVCKSHTGCIGSKPWKNTFQGCSSS